MGVSTVRALMLSSNKPKLTSLSLSKDNEFVQLMMQK